MNTEQTIEIIKTYGSPLWQSAMRQIYFETIAYFALVAAIAVCGPYLVRVLRKEHRDEDWYPYLTYTLVGLMIFFSGLSLAYGISLVIAPEYHAFKAIIGN